MRDPIGNLAGDIVLLPRACMNIPIEDRFYFAGITHYTWHGSACEQDSHIPFILAKPNESGAEMRDIMSDFGGDSPSERELTPLVRLVPASRADRSCRRGQGIQRGARRLFWK